MRRLLGKVAGDQAVRSLAAKGSVLLSGQLVASGLAFVTTLMLASWLGAVTFGTYALVTSIVLLISQVIDIRVWETGTRFASAAIARGECDEARAVLEAGMIVNLGAGLLSAALIAAAAEPLASTFVGSRPLAGEIALYAFVAPCVAIFNASAMVLRTLDRFTLLAILTGVGSAIRLCAAAVAIALDRSLGGLLVLLVLAEAISAGMFVVAALRALRGDLESDIHINARLRMLRTQIVALARFLVTSNVHGTLRAVNTHADVLALGLLAMPAAAGTLKLAKTLTLPVAAIQNPYFQAMYPDLARDWALARTAEMRNTLVGLTRTMVSVVAPVAVLICLATPLLAPVLGGSDYEHLAWTTVPLAVGWLINGVVAGAHAAALAMNMQLVSLKAAAVATIVQLALLTALVPSLGAPGAALAFLAFVAVWYAALLPAVLRRLARPPSPQPKTATRTPY